MKKDVSALDVWKRKHLKKNASKQDYLKIIGLRKYFEKTENFLKYVFTNNFFMPLFCKSNMTLNISSLIQDSFHNNYAKN